MSGTQNVRRSLRIQARVKERGVKKYTFSDEDADHQVDTPLNNKKKEKVDTPNAMRNELKHIKESVLKPVELFTNEDVSGEALYKFQTPSKKNAMTNKAHSCRTPASIKRNLLPIPKVILKKIDLDSSNPWQIPKKDSISRASVTPRKFRPRISLNESESESVSEPSDYVPSEDESEDEITGSENTECSNDEEEEAERRSRRQKFLMQANLLSTPKRVNRKNKPAIIHKDFHMQADDYFLTQAEKVVTSDRTLGRLRNSHLTKEKLEQLIANQNYITTHHKKNIASLTTNYTTLFPMWYFIMEQGYTVLLHGLGSKRSLINDFHKNISYHPSLVINGFFPSLTTKDILDGIINDLMEVNCPGNTGDCLDLIEKALKKNPKDRLYLLIHNIDGIMLRSNKAQELLSSLASIPNLCVLASVDHINAPLLWDHAKRSKFNFFWWDTTTFFPYQEETSYENSLLVQKSGALALSSLRNVFLSLTSNAKSIYILLAKNQLSKSSNVNFTGMAFKDLYRAAREGFLVSSDLALRAQLTEFIDHKLVKSKRNIDSVEQLVIPLNDGLLKQFLEEHDI